MHQSILVTTTDDKAIFTKVGKKKSRAVADPALALFAVFVIS